MQSSRRRWFKSALTLGAAVPLGMSLFDQLMAMPVSNVEEDFFRSLPPEDIKIRLNSNENPYGPSARARTAVQQILSEGNRYPFGFVEQFKKILADKEGVTPDHITLGAGSSELLCVAGEAFGIEGGRMLSANPTFPVLMNFATNYGAKWDQVDVNDKLEHDLNKMMSAIKADTKLVFVCNPNNPTGTWVDPKLVSDFCAEASKKTIVYSDEAYLEFMEPAKQKSMVDLVKQDANVIVSRTFSKIYGIAGLRIGYVVAKPDLIRRMERYKMGIPVSQTALAAAQASLGDDAFMKLSRDKNAEARQHLFDYLDKQKFFYGKSFTNFVFADTGSRARQIMDALAQRGIGIRVWEFKGKEWCRISVGTLDEMKTLTKALSEIIS